MAHAFARYLWSVGIIVGISLSGERVVLAADDGLAAAEAAVEKAKAAEKAADDEWNSREMARSATREIARSERQKTQAALDAAVAARANCERLAAAAKAARDAAEANKADDQKANLEAALKQAEADAQAASEFLSQKEAALRAATELLINNTEVANKATEELYVAEDQLRDKMAGVRVAEQAALELKAQAAEQAKPGDGAANRKELCDSKALCAWEAQQWLAVQRHTATELAEQSGEAARIASAITQFERDQERRAAATRFAEAQTAAKSAADKTIADRTAAMDAAEAKVYPLKVAAWGGLTPLAPEEWNYEKARHLLARAGFGGTPQEVDELCKMGLYKAVDRLVNYHQQPSAEGSFDATPPLGVDPLSEKLRGNFIRGQVNGAREGVERGQVGALRQWWLKRMVESPRPLQEKLTLFWHGHFATQDSVVKNSYSLYRQNMLLREHAAGSFRALLTGIVHDPAMLRYLDNNRNVKGQPNENLAREIMELFSMGVDQGYTEKDIVEAARALTGYTYDNSTGTYSYDQAQHDPGDKTIFGKTGPWCGDDLVRLILEQPATSRFVAFKSLEFFAYRDPAQDAVDRLSNVLRANNYELRPMLRNLFLSAEFYGDKARGTQIKCPVQLVVGTLHDLGVKKLARYDMLDNAVREMGQDLLEPPDVKGWRYGRTWISTSRLFVRYNLMADLIRNAPRPEGAGIDIVQVLENGGCTTPGEIVDYFAKTCLAKPLTPEGREALVAALAQLPPRADWGKRRDEANQTLRQLLILMLSTPEFQLS